MPNINDKLEAKYFNDLKARLKAELNRRGGEGSV